ncbi:hypothetical protein JA33_067 [Dickeya phage vB_DsoM_JA33]|uniref:Uncharacterized protein n=3 Tax=Salmondvirus JA11 TaxID=2734141 RepID=A0A384ZW46_9CAUD|nr:hypothetical protein HOU32_gp067 [Dickeya phage vB_DsoM_JA11]AXG66471.1 hypothetical protein JA13_068 [Dickeya phage vB_DsoM_JA13]AXG67441.1 hypothetical protein JA33_067 [Dickeya phage vB_DsoM_JA33]AYD79872.1 hypothetical protein JA11_067 [Dickeya phage vB_DsoM_JA11]
MLERDKNTGRFRKNSVTKDRGVEKEKPTAKQDLTDAEDLTDAKDSCEARPTESLPESISMQSNAISLLAQDLELRFSNLGLITKTPVYEHFNCEDDCDEDEGQEISVDDSNYRAAFSNIANRLSASNRTSGTSHRAFNVVRFPAINSLLTLNYVLDSAMRAFDNNNGEAIYSYSERTGDGFVGFSENENLFNELAMNARRLMNELSTLLLGRETVHIEGEESINYERVQAQNLLDHLSGVSGVMSTILAHGKSFEKQLSELLA